MTKHGTITLQNYGHDARSTFAAACEACDWSEVHDLDYDVALAALEHHIVTVHGDYGPELVVGFL